MPDITLPYTFTTLTAADADQLCENVYAPNATPDSLDVVNHMDEDNLDGGTELTAEKVQFGAMHRVARASRNVNLNFTNEQFSVASTDRQGCFIAGGCKELDVPSGHTLVQVHWHIWFDQDLTLAVSANDPVVRFYKKAPSDDYLTWIAGKSLRPHGGFVGVNAFWHDFWWATAEEGRWQFALGFYSPSGSLVSGSFLTVQKVKLDAISSR